MQINQEKVKKVSKYTYNQISEITGNKVQNLRNLAYKLELKRKIYKNITYIDQEGLDKILQHLEPKISKTNNKYKIRVVETYMSTNSLRETSKLCKISRVTAKKIIDEWKDTQFVIVDSSINFPEKFQTKGIFYRGKSWGYEFMYKGQKYYKRGFENEKDAIDALYLLKEKLKNE